MDHGGRGGDAGVRVRTRAVLRAALRRSIRSCAATSRDRSPTDPTTGAGRDRAYVCPDTGAARTLVEPLARARKRPGPAGRKGKPASGAPYTEAVRKIADRVPPLNTRASAVNRARARPYGRWASVPLPVSIFANSHGKRAGQWTRGIAYLRGTSRNSYPAMGGGRGAVDCPNETVRGRSSLPTLWPPVSRQG